MELAPHIYRYAPDDPDLLSRHGVHAYFVVDGGEAIMVDPFDARDAVIAAQLEQLAALGRPRLKMMLNTHGHFDHFEGALKLKEATGATFGAHALDAPAVNSFLETDAVDHLLVDGEVLEVGALHLEVIHTPGHTPGGLCFYLREEKILFSGDHIMGLGTVVVGPPGGEVAAYIESLRRLLTYDIALICPGHGPLVRRPHRKIQELIDHRLDRERQVVAALGAGPKTPDDLVQEIYPEIAERLVGLARRTMLGHLIKLQSEGRAAPADEGEEGPWALG